MVVSYGHLGGSTIAHFSIGPIEITQDNSQVVREDTAELASWALSDKTSFVSGHSPTRHLLCPTAPSTSSRNNVRIDEQERWDQPKPAEFDCPNAIPEASEPASPSSMQSSRKSPGVSALSQMFKNTPPTEAASSGSDDEDKVLDDMGLEPVTVREGIISQPTEQTALFLKKQVYGSNGTDINVPNHDLENQETHWTRTTGRQNGDSFSRVVERGRSAMAKIFRPKSWGAEAIWKEGLLRPARYTPAVILGLLLNILDALSYGRSNSPPCGLATN